MSRGIQRWSEEAIARLQKEGRGKGRGPTYSPWVRITDLYSEGRTHEPYSHKTQRSHQLLSDGEFDVFVMLERARDITDIREGYPVDRDITLEIAKDLGIKHQCYPGTHVPLVMTLDFLATRMCDGDESLAAFSVKVAADLEKPTVVECLELERATCQALSVPYHLLVKEHLPKTKLKNLHWIRGAQLDQDRIEPYEGFYDEHMALMVQDILAVRYDGSLVDYCTSYDRRYSVQAGTALRVARMLLSQRTLSMDLNNPEPQLAHMDTFKLSALPGRLRHVGGA